MISELVYQRSDISDAAKMLWGLIQALERRSSGSYMSQAHMAHRLGWKRRKVQRVLAELLGANLIADRGWSGSRTRLYRSMTPASDLTQVPASDLTQEGRRFDASVKTPASDLTQVPASNLTHKNPTENIKDSALASNLTQENQRPENMPGPSTESDQTEATGSFAAAGGEAPTAPAAPTSGQDAKMDPVKFRTWLVDHYPYLLDAWDTRGSKSQSIQAILDEYVN